MIMMIMITNHRIYIEYKIKSHIKIELKKFVSLTIHEMLQQQQQRK